VLKASAPYGLLWQEAHRLAYVVLMHKGNIVSRAPGTQAHKGGYERGSSEGGAQILFEGWASAESRLRDFLLARLLAYTQLAP
jgi:hypothetical protein